MSEIKVEKAAKVEKVRAPPKCKHTILETVSAREAEIDIPLAVERRLDISRCKSCEAIVVKDKKK